MTPKIVLIFVGAMCLGILGYYGHFLYTASPAVFDLPADREKYFKLPAYLLFIQMGMCVLAIALTFMNKGKIGQALYFVVGVISITFVLGPYGFVVMSQANPLLRSIAFTQWSMMMTCLLLISTIDVYLFKGAKEVGQIVWGKMPDRSQYVLILLCIAIVLNIGLMGFIRSGLREDWHIYGVLRDTSEWAFTPTNATMAKMVSSCLLVFLGVVSFLFWLTGIDDKGKKDHGHGSGEDVIGAKESLPLGSATGHAMGKMSASNDLPDLGLSSNQHKGEV
jgi:hypothetical protein